MNSEGHEHILLVEDDAVVIKALETQLRNAGYKVVSAASSAEAIRAVVTQQPELMILDLTLVDGVSVNGLRDGLSMLQWLRRTLPEANFPVIIHTADTSAAVDERAQSFGITSIFRKGDSPKGLLQAVRKTLDERKSREAA